MYMYVYLFIMKILKEEKYTKLVKVTGKGVKENMN